MSNSPYNNTNYNAPVAGLPIVNNPMNLEMLITQYFNLNGGCNPKPSLILLANIIHLSLPFSIASL